MYHLGERHLLGNTQRVFETVSRLYIRPLLAIHLAILPSVIIQVSLDASQDTSEREPL